MKEIITPLEHGERLLAMGIRPEFVGDYICALYLPDGSVLLLQGEIEVLREPNPLWSCVTLYRAGLIDSVELERMKPLEAQRMASEYLQRQQGVAERANLRLIEAREKLDALGGAE